MGNVPRIKPRHKKTRGRGVVSIPNESPRKTKSRDEHHVERKLREMKEIAAMKPEDVPLPKATNSPARRHERLARDPKRHRSHSYGQSARM